MIDQIIDPNLRCLCIYAYIDALAAERSNYIRESSEVDLFTSFVLDSKTRYNYLDKVEPVTIYYHVEDLIKKSIKIPGFPAELDIDINSYRWDHVLFRDIVGKTFSNELTWYIRKSKDKTFYEKKLKEHRLVNLLYRMRSKLAHEMRSPGIDSAFDNDSDLEEPYYCDYGRIYREGEHLISDNVIELRIPYFFIRNILEDCCDFYINECI